MKQPSSNIEYHLLANTYAATVLPIGKRLVVMGDAIQGEYNQPYAISSLGQARLIFGDGSLVSRIDDALTGGAAAVYGVRAIPADYPAAWNNLLRFPFDLIMADALTLQGGEELIRSFVNFCKSKEFQGELVHGFFGLGPTDIDNIRDLYPVIRSFSHNIVDGLEEEGRYFSLIVDQMKDRSATAVYAGLVTGLSAGISPVNKTLDVELATEYKNPILDELRENGIVSFKESIKKGVVCHGSPCAVQDPDSAHRQISNFRIAQEIINEVASEQELYVGRVGVAYVVTEVDNIVRAILTDHLSEGRLKWFDYSITVDADNIIYTSIEVVPIFSVQKMTQYSQVKVRV